MSKNRFSIYFLCIFFYLVGVIVGIVLLLRGEESSILNEIGLSLREFLFAQDFALEMKPFFTEILKWRIGLWGLIALFYGSRKKNVILYFLFFYLGMGSGLLVEQLTIMYGLRGILLFFLLEFPHFYFYGFSYLVLGDKQNSGLMLFVSYCILMAGCILECYVNPILLYNAFKI